MNAGHTVRSDTKHPASSHVSTRLWNLPAYGKPLRSAPFHRPWKTPPIHRPRFPQLPQPPPLEEKKPEPNEESGSFVINPRLSYRVVPKPGSRHSHLVPLAVYEFRRHNCGRA